MIPNESDSPQYSSDRCDQSPLQNRMLENGDPSLSRREFLGEFLGTTAASFLIAGTLSAAAKPNSKNEIPYRTLGRTGEKVSLIGLGGYHM